MRSLLSPHEPVFIGSGEIAFQLEKLRKVTSEPLAGIFGPASITWRVSRESVLFLGAGRALLLQLAHPWVANAIAEHSRTLLDRIGRFHRTFDVTFTMIFGTLDQAVGAALRLHRRHAAICGVLPSAIGTFAEGSTYRANEVSALRWVHSTLTETTIMVHDLILPPLTADERDRLYAESRVYAALFGIPEHLMPKRWADFVAYNEEMLSSNILSVGDAAREVVAQIFAPQEAGWRVPRWYRDLTAHLLPHTLRSAFGLGYSQVQRRRAERAIARIRWLYPMLPSRLRYVAPYHEAVGRLAGRAAPDHTTQWLNRMWIGRRQLGSGPLTR
jgi:uncharacterized protein (DUF2236 family)